MIDPQFWGVNIKIICIGAGVSKISKLEGGGGASHRQAMPITAT